MARSNGKRASRIPSLSNTIEWLEPRQLLSNFSAVSTNTVGGAPDGIAVGDFNDDGRMDIVTANTVNTPASTNTIISVLFGNGNGTFQPPVPLSAGQGPDAVAVGDFNGDGTPDIAVANSTDGTVSVLLSNGNGTFQGQRTFAVEADPLAIAVGDLTGNGDVDIVTTNNGGTVSVLMGNGNGTFAPQTTMATVPYTGSVAIADFNGDGIPDLVTANDTGVEIFLGNGNGTFQPQQNIAPQLGSQTVAVGDLNGDGKVDIVATQFSSYAYGGNAVVFLGNGNGTFTQLPQIQIGLQGPRITGGSPVGAVAATIADVNGDGKPDLIVSTRYSPHEGSYNYTTGVPGEVVVLHGNGNGTFSSQQQLALQGTFGAAYGVAVADFSAGDRRE